MRLNSLCIATFLVQFLIWGSTAIFAAQNPGSSDHKIRKVSEIKDHQIIDDRLKHESSTTISTTLWSERENEMEKLLSSDKKSGTKVGSTARGRSRTLEIGAGSRLPDCLHACGSCSPCTLVMVSLACASHVEDAESCPVSYRCMCNGKSYPVP